LQGDSGATGPTGPTGLIGPTGIAGATGATGAIGASGATGPNGLIGPTGLTGPMGVTGSVGATGAQGNVGSVGASGSTGATGSQGEVGATGSNGASGAQGSIGLTGATGPTGVAGVTRINYGSVFFSSVIQGNAGTSQSSLAFGSFKAGKNYLVHIHFDTYNLTKNLLTYPLMLDVAATGATPTMRTTYTVSNGSYWVSGAKQDEVIVSAEVILDGTNVLSNYQLVGTLTCGTSTSAFAVTLSGKYSSIEVTELVQE